MTGPVGRRPSGAAATSVGGLNLTSELVQPGAWVAIAQGALDRLSMAVTVENVVAEFGTARAVTVAVLGSPTAGGHATRAAVRTTGRLITHRLGPALAAEALSWAASIGDVVDHSAVEALLALAAEATETYQPLRIADRVHFCDDLRRFEDKRQRRRRLLDLWRQTHTRFARSFPDEDLLWSYSDWEDLDSLYEWLTGLEPAPKPEPPDLTDLINFDDATQARLIMTATNEQIEVLACSEALFEFSDAVVGRCLLDATRLVIDNPVCPTTLRRRVVHPYDLATTELAVRAGADVVSRERLRRQLVGLAVDELRDLGDRIPTQLLDALRAFGLVTADLFVDGALTDVDVTDVKVLRAAFGSVFEEWCPTPMSDELGR